MCSPVLALVSTNPKPYLCAHNRPSVDETRFPSDLSPRERLMDDATLDYFYNPQLQ